MTSRLLGVWLYCVSVLVPAAERARWREEWHADIDDARASGAGVAETVALAIGIAAARICRYAVVGDMTSILASVIRGKSVRFADDVDLAWANCR